MEVDGTTRERVERQKGKGTGGYEIVVEGESNQSVSYACKEMSQ
jgi:hypothetical protein